MKRSERVLFVINRIEKSAGYLLLFGLAEVLYPDPPVLGLQLDSYEAALSTLEAEKQRPLLDWQ